jgi:glycosyltransferase involved in cell wall biosynthesis
MKTVVQGPLRILFLGRINKLKGLHLLLETLSSINATLVELSIYGNSDDYQYESVLRAKTSQLSNIHWKGKLSQSEVIPTMRKYDILFLGSTFSEMSPLVIQEAFAAGLPVLASNVHGNAEQIKHGINGLLFKFNDKADLKYQIEKLINDPSYIQKLSENIIKPKPFDNVAEQYLELYNDMLT